MMEIIGWSLVAVLAGVLAWQINWLRKHRK